MMERSQKLHLIAKAFTSSGLDPAMERWTEKWPLIRCVSTAAAQLAGAQLHRKAERKEAQYGHPKSKLFVLPLFSAALV